MARQRQDNTTHTNTQHTPSPWWWAAHPSSGVDLLLEGWAALPICFLRPPLKDFNRFTKLNK
jgi:hypothetical protein